MNPSPTEQRFGGARPLRGQLRLPGDKSISHRAYLFAALADGPSHLTNLSTGDDVHATRLALEHAGVRIRTAKGGRVTVRGAGVVGLTEPDVVLDCGNSGTTMRIMSGLLAGRPFLSVLSGDASLRRRPMRRVIEPLREMGASVDGRDDGERAPLVIRGGDLRGQRHELDVASAQVKSALVLAGLQSQGATTIVSPAITRDHTERMLVAAGAPIDVEGTVVTTRAGAPQPFDLDVPGDASSAAYFVVGAIVTPGSAVELLDVCVNPTRMGYVDVLRRMGADIEVEVTGTRLGEPVGTLRARHSALSATVIGGDEIPNVQDEIPVLAVAAAFADGVSEIRDAAELRLKESDRIGAVEQELSQLGVGVESWSDGLAIRGGRPKAGALKSHGDHRMAMAGAIVASAIDGETTVRGWRCVSTSYPEFVEHLESLAGAS